METVTLPRPSVDSTGGPQRVTLTADVPTGGSYRIVFIDESSDSQDPSSSQQRAAHRRWLRREFKQLADEWHEATDHLSSPSQIALNAAYQEIIGLGPDVIPFIVEDMGTRGGEWFWALKAITRVRQSPIPPEIEGDFDGTAHAWIEWLRANEYIE